MLGLWVLIRRDLQLGWRQKGTLLQGLSFYALIALLFPLALSPSPQLLASYAPGFIWIAALLSTLLGLSLLFKEDQQDGSLELWAMRPLGLLTYSLGRTLSHWFMTFIPLVMMTPIMGLALNLPDEVQGTLILSLLLGSPWITLVGAFAVALTQNLPKSQSLLPLLMLPLTLPVLIFATHAVTAAAQGLPYDAQLYTLAALSLFGLVSFPFATAAALRLGV